MRTGLAAIRGLGVICKGLLMGGAQVGFEIWGWTVRARIVLRLGAGGLA